MEALKQIIQDLRATAGTTECDKRVGCLAKLIGMQYTQSIVCSKKKITDCHADALKALIIFCTFDMAPFERKNTLDEIHVNLNDAVFPLNKE